MTNPATSARKRWVGNGGYWFVTGQRGHPNADSRGAIREHVLIVADALGHAVPAGVHIHHVDEDRTNNAHTNLVVCQDLAYHFLLHRRQRAYDACGDPNAVRCGLCAGYDRQGEMTLWTRANGSVGGYHRSCRKRTRTDYRPVSAIPVSARGARDGGAERASGVDQEGSTARTEDREGQSVPHGGVR